MDIVFVCLSRQPEHSCWGTASERGSLSRALHSPGSPSPTGKGEELRDPHSTNEQGWLYCWATCLYGHNGVHYSKHERLLSSLMVPRDAQNVTWKGCAPCEATCLMLAVLKLLHLLFLFLEGYCTLAWRVLKLTAPCLYSLLRAGGFYCSWRWMGTSFAIFWISLKFKILLCLEIWMEWNKNEILFFFFFFSKITFGIDKILRVNANIMERNLSEDLELL